MYERSPRQSKCLGMSKSPMNVHFPQNNIAATAEAMPSTSTPCTDRLAAPFFPWLVVAVVDGTGMPVGMDVVDAEGGGTPLYCARMMDAACSARPYVGACSYGTRRQSDGRLSVGETYMCCELNGVHRCIHNADVG